MYWWYATAPADWKNCCQYICSVIPRITFASDTQACVDRKKMTKKRKIEIIFCCLSFSRPASSSGRAKRQTFEQSFAKNTTLFGPQSNLSWTCWAAWRKVPKKNSLAAAKKTSKIFFERSEFLIDTSQKKSLRVCTRARVHACSTSLGLSVSYYVPHTYVSQLGSQDTYM